jgi:SAM-dependent MidA family methyltransferase
MADQLSPLDAEIRRRIAIAGPMPVGQYMRLCLTHPDYGYYMTRDPFGTHGDFITAPENVRLVELGPGRGSMMLDVMRAAHIVPAFRVAVVVHLVEISPALEQRQRQALAGTDLPVEWHRSLDEVPDGPTIILANEFFDSLPVQQAVMCADGWHERVVATPATRSRCSIRCSRPRCATRRSATFLNGAPIRPRSNSVAAWCAPMAPRW